jgi:hypothetical protein
VWIAAAKVSGLYAALTRGASGRDLVADRLGLLVTVYPVPAKVCHDRLGSVTHNRRLPFGGCTGAISAEHPRASASP